MHESPKCASSHTDSRLHLRTSRMAAATAAVVAETNDNFLMSQEKGKMGGGGDGDGPTPLEIAQVLSYRVALLLTALCWFVIYSLDFFMTSGVSIIDGSVQTMALSVSDVCAGLAALCVPTGSLLAAGALLKLCGVAAIGSWALGMAGAGSPWALAGPACVILICAREIFWFGMAYRGGAALAIVVFGATAVLRAGNMDASSVTALEDSLYAADAYSMATMPQPIGPPVPLSFVASVCLFVLGFSKAFEPIGEDLDEEGEKWDKKSSMPLTGFKDQNSAPDDV